MNSEQALAILKNADRELEAPASLEPKLLEAFRRHHSRRARTPWLLVAALAAAMALAFYVGRTPGPRPAPLPASPMQQVVQTPPGGPAAGEDTVSPVAQRVSQPPRESHERLRPPSAAERASGEIMTEFFPLMDVAPPLGHGQLLRVAVPASAMRTVGLPVREERLNETVEAEVLIGEEGMARAIRFVSLQQ
jgi:hypothetical protein